jgi:hypothetical protein
LKLAPELIGHLIAGPLMSTYHRRQRTDVLHALDEVRFGTQRILNLRESLPTAPDAVARTESWLRERQVAGSDEVLIITGRGKGSPGGVPVVRDAVRKTLGALRRRGVVAGFRDHTEGSFVVTLAPVSQLLEAPRRNRDRGDTRAEPLTVPALRALEPSTQRLLRELAVRSLDALGADLPGHFVDAEMLRQFSLLAGGISSGAGSEERLRQAIVRTIEELDDL